MQLQCVLRLAITVLSHLHSTSCAVSSSPTIFPLFLSLVYSFIRVCKFSDGCCCSTVECKSQMLPWKLLLRLFSNVLFLLLGESYSLIKFYCWLWDPLSVDLSLHVRGWGGYRVWRKLQWSLKPKLPYSRSFQCYIFVQQTNPNLPQKIIIGGLDDCLQWDALPTLLLYM